MVMLEYHHDVNKEEMRKEIFNKTCEADVILTLPTVFYFEGSDETQLHQFHYSSKLSEMVYTNLQVFKDRGWNALVLMDESGFTHVFFGKNDKELKIPEIFTSPVIGSC